jgi:hypothetical protein
MKALCVQCKVETNHIVLREITRFSGDEEFWTEGKWQIIECKGCEGISFREVWKCSEDIDPSTSVTLYPFRSFYSLTRKSFINVPDKIKSIYNEVIDAFNRGLLVLCSGGIRAVIDGICLTEGIHGGPVEMKKHGEIIIQRKKDLQGKIGGLYEKKLLTKQHAEVLHEHRLLGNEALHSLNPPTRKELKIAIEIIEHTLVNIYELSEKRSDLRYIKQKRIERRNSI